MNDMRHLTTDRLAMRHLTLDDAELVLAVWNDPAFLRYVGDRGVRTVEAAAEALREGVLRLYEEHGYGPFRVALRDSDTPIGICGLFRREVLDDPDIGFALLPAFCGRGYAHEAASAVVGHARNDLGITRLTAIVSPDNMASTALIEKLGLSYEASIRMPGDDDDVSLYAVDL